MSLLKRALVTARLFVLGSLLCACADPVQEEAGIQGDEVDLRSGFSKQGLTIETVLADQVTGRFERRGTVLLFDLSRDHESRQLVVRSRSGEPILDSTLKAGIDTTSLFGGRAVLTGPIEASPTVQGDPTAVEDIASCPEALLLPELKEALIAHDFAEAIYEESALQGVAEIDKHTQALAQGWFDGTYHHLPFGASYDLWSWTFWGTTTVLIASEEDPVHGFAAAEFRPWGGRPEYVRGYGVQKYYRQWWGARVFVTNTLLPLCSVDGSWCQNTTMIAANW